MTTKDIIAAVTAAIASHGGHLRLETYHSSEGEVADLEVRLIGPEGYRDLLRESLQVIDEIERPVDMPGSDWNAAVSQLKASWQKSLLGDGAPRGSLTKDARGFYTKPGDEDTVVLLHLRRLHRKVCQPSEKAATNHRDNVTRAKAWLRETCPIGQYLGQVNLRPGKVGRVGAPSVLAAA